VHITIAVASRGGWEGNKIRRNYKVDESRSNRVHTCYSPLAVPDPLIADAAVRQQTKMVVVAHQSTDYTRRWDGDRAADAPCGADRMPMSSISGPGTGGTGKETGNATLDLQQTERRLQMRH